MRVRDGAIVNGTGLDHDGFIEREGDLARVPQAFAPVVEAARTAIRRTFGPSRMHSAYLYGSIPRGTAVPGMSDLDILGAGVLLYSTATLLSDIERNDLGWFVACLCTPLTGEDLAARLPRYRPTSLLARETNGDLGDLLPRWAGRFGEARTDASLHLLSRGIGRRLVRTGFTLVMPRWGGWTSDLDLSATVFGRYYPARREQMQAALAAARTPATGSSLLGMLINDFGPWLAAEYTAVHGRKTPRG
jgi:uncharacterized protein